MAAPASTHREKMDRLEQLIHNNTPPELLAGKRFVAWRYEDRKGQAKPAKMPYSPNAPKGASSAAPADWTDFDTAMKYARVAGLDGVMRAFDPADGYVGVDLDNCRDPETGELTPEAAERVRRADTYTEASPSGTGIKMWMTATLPPFGRHKGDVEMYCAARFFTLTGETLDGAPAVVGYRPDYVLALHREVFGDAPAATLNAGDLDRPIPALEHGDEDVIRLASGSPRNGERFRRLWSGDTSDYAIDGNDGASEADCALAELLAYYGGPDRERIERLMLRSGLSREKWDRPDYLPRTIDTALRGKTRFYGDNVQPKAPAPGSDGASTCACESCPHRAEEFRLRGLIFDRDDLIESQQAIIRAHNGVERQLRAEVAGLNRRIYADYRLAKVKTLTSSQKDTIRALARVATGRAEHFGTDAPIITAATLGAEIGKHASTARAAAEAVCGLPGAPIARATVPGGEYGQVTAYELAVRDPAEIVEQFVVIAENLEERVSNRPQPPRCDKHPTAPTRTYSRTVCGRCRKTLASTFPGEDALLVQNAHIGGQPDTRGSTGSICEQNARIGAGTPEDCDRRGDYVQVARIGSESPAGVGTAPPPLATGTGACETHGLPLLASERPARRCSMCKSPPSLGQLSPGREIDGPRCGYVKPNGRTCVATLYGDLGMGWGRCRGCGQNRRLLAAVAGGAE